MFRGASEKVAGFKRLHNPDIGLKIFSSKIRFENRAWLDPHHRCFQNNGQLGICWNAPIQSLKVMKKPQLLCKRAKLPNGKNSKRCLIIKHNPTQGALIGIFKYQLVFKCHQKACQRRLLNITFQNYQRCRWQRILLTRQICNWHENMMFHSTSTTTLMLPLPRIPIFCHKRAIQ